MTSGASAFRERRLRQVRAAQLLAAAGGLATLVGGGYLVDAFSTGALVACVAGPAALAGGVALAKRLARTVRYRVDRPNSTAVLAAKMAALLAVFVATVVVMSAVDAPSAPRSVVVLVVVGCLATVVNTHAARWTLFQIDATGMKVGQAGVPWPAVARLDLAAAGPGFVEIGVQLVAGQVVSGTPAPGRVLGDLPVCTVVPAAAVQVEHIRWAVREFGNPAVPVVVRDQPRHTPPAGMPAPPPAPPVPAPPAEGTTTPPPAPSRGRRTWLVAGAVALAAVLVAGAVTAVVLAGGDEPGQAAAEAKPGPKYSAANVPDPCDLIDVYVLKRWSTVTEIVTEPTTDKHPDYDYLHCGAHSDSQYLVGRVTHLEMVVAVAESAAAARTFQAKQEKHGLWTVSGDVSDDGTVPGLAEHAEFEQAISTYGDHTRADYVLRVRDDNLVFLLKFGSDADRSDGPGVTVPTLADTATAQARAAMEKLRTRPEEKKRENREPAAVPKTINDAVTLPGTVDLMARIRAADPCELHDRTFIERFGRVAAEPHQALGLAECRLMGSYPDHVERTVFGIDLDEYLSDEERADLVPEDLDGMAVFHTKQSVSDGCVYYVPFGRSGFGASVSVGRYVPGGAEPLSWPQACAVARDYTAAVGPKVAELPARSAPAPEPTLAGKDPCLAEEVVARLVPDWKPGPVSRYYSAQCRFTVAQGDEVYEFDLAFDRDAEQLGDEPAEVGGLHGVWLRYDGLCSLSLVHVPESTPDAWDAHNISASVQWKGPYGLKGSRDECTLAQGAAELLIDSL
ncbi:hypothetical protein [Actinophytocola sp. KF-1]